MALACLIFIVLAISQIFFIQQGFKLAQRQLNSNDKEYKWAQKVLENSQENKGDHQEEKSNIINISDRF